MFYSKNIDKIRLKKAGIYFIITFAHLSVIRYKFRENFNKISAVDSALASGPHNNKNNVLIQTVIRL